jgi:ribosome-associated translation inhibitor RaiA
VVREKAERLEKFARRVAGCTVVVEAPHRHHSHGFQYLVRIHVMVPGAEIVVSRQAGLHAESQDLHVAIRDAFDAACRQLEDYARRRRGEVKTHEAPSVSGG